MKVAPGGLKAAPEEVDCKDGSCSIYMTRSPRSRRLLWIFLSTGGVLDDLPTPGNRRR